MLNAPSSVEARARARMGQGWTCGVWGLGAAAVEGVKNWGQVPVLCLTRFQDLAVLIVFVEPQFSPAESQGREE